MTFSEAYAISGPDVEAIAKLLGIAPAEADRLINEEMERRHREKMAPHHQARAKEYRRQHNIALRSELRDIRARSGA